MKQIFEDLWQTRMEIPFEGVQTHAYFLQCEEGNVFFYNTGHVDEIKHIAELGGIKYQYLSHRDEAGILLKEIREQFQSGLCCHSKEQAAISETCVVDVVFSQDVSHFSGIEVIYTPGHTDGSVSFLYNSPLQRTYLFTGDTLFQTDGAWETIVFPVAGGSIDTLISSLHTYRRLNPDVVIWSASGVGSTSYAEINKGEWINILDKKIQELTE